MDKTPHLSISDKDLSATSADVRHDHHQSQLDGVVDSSLILDELRNIQPYTSTVLPTQPATTSLPPSFSLLVAPPPHYAFTSHTPQPSPSFRSLFPLATTAYNDLGLSHPPFPLLTSASLALNRSVCQLAFRARPTHHFTQHTPPLYTTHSPSSLPHLPSPTHYPYLPPTPSFHSTHTFLPAFDPLLYHSPSSVKT
ncbi:unnamed protein product [Prunus armeniaca]|uniref:Uncharacterized protein n=1 Tax=Prunus armeniaca TaxID=36596 RepID=A0A6J5WWS3_PRUAR|nr:unnamed protein product [Prunus armeniaca]